MAGNTINVQGSYIDVHDNEHVYLSVDKAEVSVKNAVQESPQITDESLVQAIEGCQAFFWGNSSYAVVFCVCRDDYGMAANKTAFERRVEGMNLRRSYSCPKGTLTNAFSDNPIYNSNVNKWEIEGASQRIIKLRDELRKRLRNT